MMVNRHIPRGKTKVYAGENLFSTKDRPPTAEERKKREAYIAQNRRVYDLLLTKPRNKYAQILGVELVAERSEASRESRENTIEEGNEP